MNHAYIQSASDLKIQIFVEPEHLELSPVQLLYVVKPLYGLTDVGDYWGATLTDYHKTN